MKIKELLERNQQFRCGVMPPITRKTSMSIKRSSGGGTKLSPDTISAIAAAITPAVMASSKSIPANQISSSSTATSSVTSSSTASVPIPTESINSSMTSVSSAASIPSVSLAASVSSAPSVTSVSSSIYQASALISSRPQLYGSTIVSPSTSANLITSSSNPAVIPTLSQEMIYTSSSFLSLPIRSTSSGIPVSYTDPICTSDSSTNNTSANLNTQQNELRQLQMKLEILEIQNKIYELESKGQNIQAHNKIKYEELDVIISKFSGDNFSTVVKWLNDFEDYTNSCRMNDVEKFLCIKRRLDGTAKEFVENLGYTSYDHVKSELLKMFSNTVMRRDVYRQLSARKLKANESCKAYVVAMYTIAKQIDIAEIELLDIILDGIVDNSLNKCLLYGCSSINELISRLGRYEQKRQNQTDSKNLPNMFKNELRCFNCSKYGHYKNNCPLPQ